MGNIKFRLYFIDAMRAWAILMMLQGHFVDGLLDPVFRDNSNGAYTTWKYFRGITAPVFFTVSGFIFTYLLIKSDIKGWNNPRVKKGIKRGLQLILIGYLLRLNIFGLLSGHIYSSFYLVDVLHCIGFSILLLIAIYTYAANKKGFVFPTILLISSFFIFLLEPAYKDLPLAFLPDFIANYFTKVNGSVFTLFPWFGYAAFGAFMSVLFHKYKTKKYLYTIAISSCIVLGFGLIFFSSRFFLQLFSATGIQVFADVFNNNYLFIRLGDVLLVFAVFMLIRKLLTARTILKVGQNTLSIYVIHFVILYGSFTGLGLYKFFHHTVNPYIVIPGALAFMIVTTYLSLQYDKHEALIKQKISLVTQPVLQFVNNKAISVVNWVKVSFRRR
jgi:uncharacterized membrane protein